MREYIDRVRAQETLSESDAAGAIREILTGSSTVEETRDFLLALRDRGYVAVELAAFANEMLNHATIISPKVEILADNCGTGGDRVGTFNISTVAAIVAAATGEVAMAKHGNRSFSSKCGSADVFEALGVKLLPPDKVEKCIEEVNIGFLFAPYFHPAMKNAAPARKQIDGPTVFNLLGPQVNPANPHAQLIGVYDEKLARTVAETALLRYKNVVVVHGYPLDEVSPCGGTRFYHVRAGNIEDYVLAPAYFGVPKANLNDLLGGDAQTNAGIFRRILRGEEMGAKRDAVKMNAATLLYAAGVVPTISIGMKKVKEVLDSGTAYNKLRQLVDFTSAAAA